LRPRARKAGSIVTAALCAGFKINLVLFPALNGYVRRRGYFEVVALRRLDAAAARAMRNRFAGRITLGGAVIAGLFALARINLMTPVVATALTVRVFEMLPGAPPQPAACSTA
jgi:CysZ protein